MGIAGLTFIVGSLFLRETHGQRIWDEMGAGRTVAAD
jgi:hypothetical protein